MKQVLLGRIKEAKVQVQRFFRKDILKWEGKEVEISLSEGSKTQQQLGYLFGVVLPIVSEHTGFTKEEALQVFYERFSTYHKEHNGRIYTFQKTLSGMTVSEASELIDKIVNYARMDMGLIIPEPDKEFIYEG